MDLLPGMITVEEEDHLDLLVVDLLIRATAVVMKIEEPDWR